MINSIFYPALLLTRGRSTPNWDSHIHRSKFTYIKSSQSQSHHYHGKMHVFYVLRAWLLHNKNVLGDNILMGRIRGKRGRLTGAHAW